MVRQTARRFAEERILPLIRDCYRDARFPSELIPEMAELGFLGANLEGYGCAGMSNVEYGLIMQELERGRFRHPQLRFRAGRAGDVPHPRLRLRGAEAAMAAAPAERPGDRLLRADRAGFRLEPRRHAHHRAARGRRLDPQRREDLDHQRRAWPTWRWSGRAPPEGIVGFLVERGTPGYTTSDIHGKWSMRASVTSSLSFSDCRVSEANRLPGARGLKAPALVPLAGALRHRLGRDRRGHGLLRNGAAVFDPAQAVRRPAHRLAPAGAGEAGLDDHRDHQGAAAGGAGGPAEGPGEARSRRTFPC